MYNIFAIISCFLYLICSIVYDRLDTPENPADYRIFYIPFALMVFALILKCKVYAIKYKWAWNFFFWLSIGQLIKHCLFNPFLQTLNDYVYLACVIGYIVHQFVNRKK